jgi:hypothetical protein
VSERVSNSIWVGEDWVERNTDREGERDRREKEVEVELNECWTDLHRQLPTAHHIRPSVGRRAAALL